MSRRSSAAPELRTTAPLFAALGDETRLRIVARLCGEGPASISHLTTGTGVTRQAITKHLEVLAGVGLVQDAKEGRERIFELRPARLADARRSLEHISEQWDLALGRLKRFVED